MSKMRTALTTGANSGIGLATTLELARRGFRSIGTVRSESKAQLVAEAARAAALDVETLLLDVTDADRCVAVIAETRPAILVNNAGYSITGSIEDVPDADARAAFETMVLTPMRLAGSPSRTCETAEADASSISRRSTGGRRRHSQVGTRARSMPSKASPTRSAWKWRVTASASSSSSQEDSERGSGRRRRREIAKREGSRYDPAYQRTLSTTRLWQPLMGDPVKCAKTIGTAATSRRPRARSSSDTTRTRSHCGAHSRRPRSRTELSARSCLFEEGLR